ncbi:ribonuclease Phyb-like [Brevipalpus obovatus]|uniref:ribonuclease Phyb-like n=1 Tax=Brevipalpus obovatus TaxID=246614 RepID=UPI003D9E1146
MMIWGFVIHLKWFLAISIFLIPVDATSENEDGEGCVRPQQFDYLMLSVMNSGMEGSIQKPSSHSWTIHGLWPQIFKRQDYGYCCAPHQHEYLNPSDLSSIEALLKEFWPSKHDNDFGFWIHEWKRHGTCAQLTEYASKKHFFLKALKLYFITNVDAALAKAGIKYNGIYSAQTILNALGNQLGVPPTLVCRNNVGSNQAISEIRFCFDSKAMKRIACSNPIGTCYKTEQLFLAGNNFNRRSRM